VLSIGTVAQRMLRTVDVLSERSVHLPFIDTTLMR
jgi:hypothetical protein